MEKALRNIVKFGARLYYELAVKKRANSGYIPPSGKLLGFEELSNMIDASLDMWLTAGRFNVEFERQIAHTLGVKYALTVNSGSSANLLALSALTSPKLGGRALVRGDEVITAAAGFPTTINPIMQNGLIPVFVDCELSSYNIDAAKIEEAITPKTKAIIVAHTLGNPLELEKISDICRRKNLWFIEDSCDALGAKYHGNSVGTFGDISTYSFYPAHHITTGEGGAVATNNALLNRILASLRDWGRDCWCDPGKDDTCKNRFKFKLGALPDGYDHKYTYSHIGYNLKMTDWQAACGLAQIKRLPNFLAKRRANAEFLSERLKGLEDVLILPSAARACEPSWFGYLISVRGTAAFKKRDLVEFLEHNGVGTRQLFAGNILRQPMFTSSDICLRIGNSALLNSRSLSDEHYGLLPNSDFVMNNTFWIGCFPALTKEQLSKSAGLIKDFVQKCAHGSQPHC